MSDWKKKRMAFIEWLDKQMYDQRLSQAELARVSKLSESAISNLRSGRRQPTPDTLNKLAVALKVSPIQVFKRAGLLPDDARE